MRQEHLSRHEFLRKAADMLQEEWQTYHRILSCPVFFNITNFHLYNATYGFRQGDLCLLHIEGILQDAFPGRPITHLGADNFAVLADRMRPTYSRALMWPASAYRPSSAIPISR